ncbi:hypothetical protein H8959_013874 [Pygathrix nigripes]
MRKDSFFKEKSLQMANEGVLLHPALEPGEMKVGPSEKANPPLVFTQELTQLHLLWQRLHQNQGRENGLVFLASCCCCHACADPNQKLARRGGTLGHEAELGMWEVGLRANGVVKNQHCPHTAVLCPQAGQLQLCSTSPSASSPAQQPLLGLGQSDDFGKRAVTSLPRWLEWLESPRARLDAQGRVLTGARRVHGGERWGLGDPRGDTQSWTRPLTSVPSKDLDILGLGGPGAPFLCELNGRNPARTSRRESLGVHSALEPDTNRQCFPGQSREMVFSCDREASP